MLDSKDMKYPLLFFVILAQIVWLIPGFVFGLGKIISWYIQTDEYASGDMLDEVIAPLNWWLWHFKGYTLV